MFLKNQVPLILSAFVALELGAGASFVLRGVTLDPSQDFSYALERRLGRHQLEVTTGPQVQASPVPALELMSVEEVERVLRKNWRGSKSFDFRHFAGFLVDLSRRHGFDPAMVLAVIKVESSFRPSVVSPMGAVGLMQLMPATARVISDRARISYADPRELRNPYKNLELGVAYLSELRSKYLTDSPYFRFAAYNLGPARLDDLRQKRGSQFKPRETGKYYRAIRDWMGKMRHSV